MYLEHFDLKVKPFSLIPDGDSIYFSSVHKSAFAILEYGLLESDGIILVTGGVGTGKTTLLRQLLRRIDYNELMVGLITNTHNSFGSFLDWVVKAFPIETDQATDSGMLEALQGFLIEQYAEGKRTVVIVDEAQNITEHDMEALRLLTNINADQAQLLQVMLVGQPELLELFSKPHMSQLAQRVSAEYNLKPLSLNESIKYVNYRLKQAGSNRNIFDNDSLMAIFYYSAGTPRIINTLCDASLVFAYGQGEDSVKFETVLEVVRNKQIGGIHREGIETDSVRIAIREALKKSREIDMLQLVK